MAAATHQPLRQDSHQYSYYQTTKHPLPPPSQVPIVRYMLPHPYSTQSPIPIYLYLIASKAQHRLKYLSFP